MKQIIENINQYKKKSADPLLDQQIAYIPKINEDQIECTVHSYLIDGRRYIINQKYEICFKLKYINFKPMHARKSINYKYGIWDMNTLVEESVIYPFMLFINGLFVPWDLIKIAVGQENYYLIINVEPRPEFHSLIHEIEYAQIISLPSHVKYEQGRWFEYDTVFGFDYEGRFTAGFCDYAFVNSTDAHHVIHQYWETDMPINAYRIFDDTSIKLTENNVFVFKNNRLATGNISNIKRAHDGNCKDENTGKVTPCLEFTVSDTELESNPSVKIDSTLLTINNGINNDHTRYAFVVFANKNYTQTADNISRVTLDALEPLIVQQNSGEANPQYLQDLQVPFEMEMSYKKRYDENVADAIKTMLSYNSSLFDSVYKDKSNLVIEEYNGAWLLKRIDEEGIVTIPRKHSSTEDEYILMMVNGLIYQYYYMCKYEANKYIIPVQNISYDDTIELLRFRNINNRVTDMTLHEDTGFQNLSPEIINDNMVLYSNVTDLDHFEYPEDGFQHFPVEYTLEYDEAGRIKVNLTNPFYYGKPLKVAYKNRYHPFCFNLEGFEEQEFVVNLGDKFMYCNDYAKYLVFYNGRRLGSDHYRLTLPVRPTTPFYDFRIYLTMPVQEGDRLDIIYVPSLMQDIIMTPSIPVSGDIVVDRSILNKGLATDLFMVWLNGKKIPRSHISDIDSNQMRITSNDNTTETLCITRYIPDIDVLTSVFKENEALWDKIISQLTNEEIYNLLGINGEELSNDEESVYANAVNIKSVMYELIREQFVANPRVDITGPFIYDYQDVDNSAIEGYDSGNNAILPVADANKSDNIDGIDRYQP